MTRTAAVGLLFVAVATSAPSAPHHAAQKRNPARLDGVLRRAVEQKRVPLVVAQVASPDEVLYEGAFGAPADSIFEIASMTKPVTSVAVMQLVEAGKVSLDQPASTYLPELASVQVVEGDRARAPKTPVTVRHLLTHTSGFVYEFLNPALHDLTTKGKIPSAFAGGDAFLRAPLFFDPGTRWEYGISTDFLGRLVEKVSGQSLEAYFQQRIFNPLGMGDTYFNVPPVKQSRLLSHHQRKTDGGFDVQPRPSVVPPVTFFSGGGGLYSTADDYLTFARALLNGGALGKARILSTETVAQMGRNQIGDLALILPASLMPQLAKPTATFPGRPDKFGYGFAVNTAAIDENRGANTMAWAGIFNTFFWVDRERKVCAVFMTQMLPFLDDGPEALIQEFDRAVYEWLPARD